jgi:phosphatidylserine decarboxylase
MSYQTPKNEHELRDQLFITLQYLLPQHLLSRAAGGLANCEIPVIKNFLIKYFIQHFHVNMEEAAEPDYEKYQSFNQFFTRALRKGARPIAEGPCIVSPADGAISQLGPIHAGRIVQAKGQDFSVLELLAGQQDLAHHFHDGVFTTIYLSPRDYHRVHAPISGTLSDMIYVPGDLFSVNNTTSHHVPRLFARNERLITVFDTEAGKVAVILVGAMIVAGIETSWSGQVAPLVKKPAILYAKQPAPVYLQKGDELGRFKLGSTVVMLFEKNSVALEASLGIYTPICMGDKLGTLTGGRPAL